MEMQKLKFSDLSEEKQAQVKSLLKRTRKKAFLFGLELIFLMLASNAIIISVDALIAHSVKFCFVAGMLNGFFLARHMINGIKQQKEFIESEVDKILLS